MKLFARQSSAAVDLFASAAATSRPSALRTSQIDELIERLAVAEVAAVDAREEIKRTEAEAQTERERVAAGYARGELELEQADERTAALDAAAKRAKRRASVTVDAVAGLRTAGAQLVNERAAEVDQALAAEDADAAIECDRLRAELAAADERRARISLRRREVQTEQRTLLATFDQDVAENLQEQRLRETRLVQWAVHQGCGPTTLMQLPEELRSVALARYEAERANLRGW